MGKKLPRRTMSISKRGVKVAEEAADLDLVEGAIGNPETDGPDGKGRFSQGQLILGWALAFALFVGVMFLGKAVFASANGNYSMLPDGYREATGLDTAAPGDAGASVTAYDDNGRSTLPSAPRSDSPFPEPQGEMPIILKVTCPDGTVHIATGPNEADAVCIRGRLVQEPVAPLEEPTATLTPAQEPTSAPIPTEEPIPPTPGPTARADCAQMRGTAYAAPAERSWYLANCLTPEPPTASTGPIWLPDVGNGGQLPAPTPVCYQDEQDRQSTYNPVTGWCESPPDSSVQGECYPPNTWAGNAGDGYVCLPLAELEDRGGRTGWITTPRGTIGYHTEPCLPGERTLPPPYADVPLCVNAADYAAIQ